MSQYLGKLHKLLPFNPVCSPKIYIGALNPQYLRMWLYLPTGPLKRWLSQNKAMRVGPSPMWLVSLKEEEI